MITKQPKSNLYGTKLVLSHQERLEHEKSVNYYVRQGYPLEQAVRRADDHLMIDRQVKAGTFRSRWQ